jgi:hypothetical protein
MWSEAEIEMGILAVRIHDNENGWSFKTLSRNSVVLHRGKLLFDCFQSHSRSQNVFTLHRTRRFFTAITPARLSQSNPFYAVTNYLRSIFSARSQSGEKWLLALWCLSVCLSVRPSVSLCPTAWNNSAPTERMVMKSDIWIFLENLLRKFKFQWNLTEITGTLRDDLCPVMISRSVLLRMRRVSDKPCRENLNTYFRFNNFLQKIVPLWDNVEKCGTTWQAADDNIIQRMRIARLMNKATDINRELCNTRCFATATMFARTRLIVTFIHTLPVL